MASTVLLGWTAFWFWAFSFAYSDGFFLYNRHARLPTFVAALVAAVAIPVSLVAQWDRFARRARGPVAALLAHAGCCLLALALAWGSFLVLSRARPPWRLEADDALGVGIDLGILLVVGCFSLALLAAAIGVRSILRYRQREGR
jgi:hypothetical protein